MPFLVPIGAAVATGLGAAAGGTAATLISAATVGGLGFGLAKVGTSLFKGLTSSPSSPGLQPLPAGPSTADAAKTSRAEAVDEQRSRLRGSATTLTGPSSLLATVGQSTGKTLLGA